MKFIWGQKPIMEDEDIIEVDTRMKNIFLCSNCGREYNDDGWEIGKEGQGNNYKRKIIGEYSVNITKCLCGNIVIVQDVNPYLHKLIKK